MSTKAIQFLFKILVFFTPLLFVSNTQELFEFPKMLFVYVIGSTIIWLFLVKKIYRQEKIQLPSTLILLFVSVNIVSTIFSSHPYTSIFGYYSRFNGGLISILIFLGLYIVLINDYTQDDIWELVLIACITILPIGILTIGQHYEFIANMWDFSTVDRAIGTFGQPNWLAAYLVMLIPTILGIFIGIKNYYLTTPIKFGWGALFLAAFVGIWFSQSISGLLGFACAVITFCILNKDKLKAHIGKFILLLTLCASFALLNPGIFKGRLNDLYIDVTRMLKAVAVENETTPNDYVVSDPGYIRQNLWKDTVNLIKSSPKTLLLGTGPETYPYAFQKFRSADLNYSSEWNFVFNKPHNYYLEIFSNIGLLGFACYMLIVFKTLSTRSALYLPGLVGLYITNVFGWPTVATSLLFWLFLAGLDKKT